MFPSNPNMSASFFQLSLSSSPMASYNTCCFGSCGSCSSRPQGSPNKSEGTNSHRPKNFEGHRSSAQRIDLLSWKCFFPFCSSGIEGDLFCPRGLENPLRNWQPTTWEPFENAKNRSNIRPNSLWSKNESYIDSHHDV